ncbi:unnamed protein product [Rhizoctonia solani]|uniref:Uncharacterized protein n=1 Tax=Rhizoctonia solani TaxID=456999 RepID=A0A8H3BVJ2_9AGAM|nr:unnamed protein product [Rhizoctonia solani]CAE6465240.1 unnamed protein product [Rhizoctonia solani]
MGNVSAAMRSVGRTIQRGWTSLCRWASQPHIRRRLIIAAVVGVAVAILVPVAIATAGFGPAGVAAGSAAAAWQPAAYGGAVAAGSTFAVLQSLGMTAGAIHLGLGLGGIAAFGVVIVDST